MEEESGIEGDGNRWIQCFRITKNGRLGGWEIGMGIVQGRVIVERDTEKVIWNITYIINCGIR